MFIFWIAVIIIIGVAENIKLSYDAYKYHQTPEFQKQYGKYHNRK